MRSYTYSNWLELAGDFPPSLNKEVANTQLKVGETPDSYGIDPGADGVLKSGSCPVGTARVATTKSVAGNTYYWYYNRLWRIVTTALHVGAPWLDDIFLTQEMSLFDLITTGIEVIPIGNDQMAVVTATGTYFMDNCRDTRGFFALGRFWQELNADGTTKVTSLDGNLVVSNTTGVFLSDGNSVKELTKLVRDSLGSFSNIAILADYKKKYIIGTDKFVIDLGNGGKLFDFGTSGFLFTSRTLQSDVDARPFAVDAIAFILEQSDTAGGTISWSSKIEDNDWYAESDINIVSQQDQYTRHEITLENSRACGRKFAIKITGLSSNIKIKSIQVMVKGFEMRGPSE